MKMHCIYNGCVENFVRTVIYKQNLSRMLKRLRFSTPLQDQRVKDSWVRVVGRGPAAVAMWRGGGVCEGRKEIEDTRFREALNVAPRQTTGSASTRVRSLGCSLTGKLQEMDRNTRSIIQATDFRPAGKPHRR
jgi:hypothetical protein